MSAKALDSDRKQRRLVRRRATESSVNTISTDNNHSASKATATVQVPTIRLLPLPSHDRNDLPNYEYGATTTYPLPLTLPLSDNSASTTPGGIIDADLHFLPVQQLSSSGSGSYTDYYSSSSNNNNNNDYIHSNYSESNSNAADSGLLWRYSATLMVSLAAWLVFLMLPKGLRKAYCRSGRRRYSNVYHNNVNKSGAASATAVSGGAANSGNNHMRTPRHANFSNSRNQQQPQQRGRQGGEVVGKNHTTMSPPVSSRMTSSSPAVTAAARFVHAVPSPEHPALSRTPDQRILQGTMDRLVGGSGIRLMAHGVQCEPKRVWIRLHMADDDEDSKDEDDDDEDSGVQEKQQQKQKQQHSLSWQTEFPRQITDASGRSSIVLFRGTTHKIDLATVLYVDVGKKTSALLKTNTATGNSAQQTDSESTVPATTCFSLLTGNGSLDLQTNSRLERDALVACLSMVLDQVHQTHEWRRLYEESTIVGASSMAASSTFKYQESSAAARSLNLSNLGSPTTGTKNQSKFNDYF